MKLGDCPIRHSDDHGSRDCVGLRVTTYTVTVISQGLAHSLANLQPETARRVLDFYHTRLKRSAGKAPVAVSA